VKPYGFKNDDKRTDGSRFYNDSLPFKSINIKLVTTILMVSAFLTILTTVYQIYAEDKRDLGLIEKRLEALDISHIPALSLSIWSLDKALIDTQLKSLLSLPDIYALRLETEYQEDFILGPSLSGKNLRKTSKPIYSIEKGDKLLIGNLEIYTDLDIVYNHALNRTTVILISEAIKTFIASIAIIFLVQRLITRHLTSIADYISHMRLKHLHLPLQLSRKKHFYNDELDTFVSALNSMRETFKQDVELLEEIRHTLQKSEEKYRLAMQATEDGLWDWNVVKEEVYYSPGWGFILGMEKPAPVFETWYSRIHPDDADEVMHRLQEHLAGKTSIWQMEHRLQKPDGSWIWVLGRGKVVQRDQDGKPLRMIGTMTDIQLKKENEEIIWHQANFDGLTNLPNRKFITEMLEQQIRKSERNGSLIWILFLDLDGFKEINDNFGHQAGDHLLQTVAKRIRQTVRSSDMVGRLGGDEFIIMLSDIPEVAGVDYFANRIIKEIGKAYSISGQQAYVTASIGISNFPNDSVYSEELLKLADQSMYAAKEGGKNAYVYCTPALQKANQLRRKISAELIEAIADNQFELFYQPIINPAQHRIDQAEVLVRWNHPEQGIIGPMAFIPIAEETNNIHQLSQWIFDTAARQFHAWQNLYPLEDFRLALNLSALQIQQHNEFHDDWLSRLHKTHLINGEQLVVEITENLLMQNNPVIIDYINRFRDAGVKIAIDDSGIGYSSLAHLNQFEVDYLKIDRSIISNLTDSSSEETLCNAIIAMAHRMNIKVTAEGVETQLQADMLKQMHCDYLQGFYFSPPLKAKQFAEKYLQQH